MEKLTLFTPESAQTSIVYPIAKRPDTLDGKTIGLYWNRKSGGDIALRRAGDNLAKLYKNVTIKFFDDDFPCKPETHDIVPAACDVIIGSTGDCGSCTSWLVHDLVQMEKRGVPCTSLESVPFEDDVKLTCASFGMPDHKYTIMPCNTITNLSKDEIWTAIDQITDQLVNNLTTKGDKGGKAKSQGQEEDLAAITKKDAETVEVSGASEFEAWEKMNALFLSERWGDGFPLIPPTEARVNAMLKGTKRKPNDIVAVMDPGQGFATVKKIAVNAVMAGCEPAHLPILIASVEAMVDDKYRLRTVTTSTGPHAPLLVVNGPIAKKLNICSGRGALGPGSQSAVNTVIGRALRLIIMNIGHAYVGELDLDTLGAPIKYSMCLAENEENSPWSPYHVDMGYSKDESTVTVFGVESQLEIFDMKNETPEGILNSYAYTINGLASYANRAWFVGRFTHNAVLLCPDHAQIIAKHGWNKQDVQAYLFSKAVQPASIFANTYENGRVIRGLRWIFSDTSGATLPIVSSPDWFRIIVTGGEATKSSYMTGVGFSITKKIEE
jgi:hypothetical protein